MEIRRIALGNSLVSAMLAAMATSMADASHINSYKQISILQTYTLCTKHYCSF